VEISKGLRDALVGPFPFEENDRERGSFVRIGHTQQPVAACAGGKCLVPDIDTQDLLCHIGVCGSTADDGVPFFTRIFNRFHHRNTLCDESSRFRRNQCKHCFHL